MVCVALVTLMLPFQLCNWNSVSRTFRSNTVTRFLNIYISQGSVATQLRCGGIFSNNFITNFLQTVLVEK